MTNLRLMFYKGLFTLGGLGVAEFTSAISNLSPRSRIFYDGIITLGSTFIGSVLSHDFVEEKKKKSDVYGRYHIPRNYGALGYDHPVFYERYEPSPVDYSGRGNSVIVHEVGFPKDVEFFKIDRPKLRNLKN